MYIFREIREIRKAVFSTKKAFFQYIFQHFFENLGFEFSSFLSEITWQPMTICTCWIQKSPKFLFLSWLIVEKTKLQTKKNEK